MPFPAYGMHDAGLPARSIANDESRHQLGDVLADQLSSIATSLIKLVCTDAVLQLAGITSVHILIALSYLPICLFLSLFL